MLDEKSATPLYRQLKDAIQKKIHTGEWAYAAKIPSEDELCRQYGISRMTVRLAVNELARLGYLYRRQGKGTFVSVPKIAQKLTSFYSFSEDITKMGYSVKSDVLEFEISTCPPMVAEKLECGGDAIYLIKRLRYVNSLPFAVETSYIPHGRIDGLTAESVREFGLYNTIERLCGVKPDRATEVFDAIILDSRSGELLRVRKNTPGYHINRVTSCKGFVFEYCETYARGDILRFNVVLDTKPYIMPSQNQEK
ncbi:MAG: GntR family transcriptional regulator [Synergistaceae bacterium]|jgi:GntR family transcriptional regulator|nr:GntR family transcriptional regulator [Synergistaceae bacterium]